MNIKYFIKNTWKLQYNNIRLIFCLIFFEKNQKKSLKI